MTDTITTRGSIAGIMPNDQVGEADRMVRMVWLILSLDLAFAIFYITILSSTSLPDHTLISRTNDFMTHLLVPAALTRPCSLMVPHCRAVMSPNTFTAFIEVTQIIAPSRSASLADLLVGWLDNALVCSMPMIANRHLGAD